MVRVVSLIYLLLFLCVPDLAQAVRLSILLKDETLHEDTRIEGILSIEHEESENIDSQSIKLKNQSLSAELINETKPNHTGTIISRYRFHLPPQSKGLQILPPISVTVEGKNYTSPSITYEIRGENKEVPVNVNGAVVLKLETFVDGKVPLYPGQEIRVGYRYIFSHDTEVVKENLPLLDGKGFKKIGNQEVRNITKGKTDIREVAQRMQAVVPGDHVVGPSSIEGYIYEQTLTQGRRYLSEKLTAVAPPLKITILAFPEKGKPASFNGAVGYDFQFKVALQSLPELSVGDRLTISLAFSGKGEFDQLPMPEICCQPGFPGKFKLSDLPPVITTRGGTKYFVVDITPLSTSIKEIPSIEFSWFNPDTNEYHSAKSEPIPITVHQAPGGIEEIPQEIPAQTPISKEPDEPSWREALENQPSLEIASIYELSAEDLRERPFSSFPMLFLVPLGLFAIYIQLDLKQRWEKKKLQEPVVKSLDLLKSAILHKEKPNFYALVREALLLGLKENKLISNEKISPQALSNLGIIGQVKQFLLRLEESRFSGQKNIEADSVANEALRLHEKIRKQN
jgi:hypothetical protein